MPTIPLARVQPILDRVLPQLLRLRVTPERLSSELRLPATTTFVLKSGEDVNDLITVVTAALDHLTAGEAAAYECAASDFAQWRDIQWPAGSVLSPPPPAAPLPPLDLPATVTRERLPIFLREAGYVIAQGMKPEALRPYLETQKGWLRGSETIDDWVTVLTTELNRLRLTDAVSLYKVRPEQFRLWRKQAWPGPR